MTPEGEAVRRFPLVASRRCTQCSVCSISQADDVHPWHSARDHQDPPNPRSTVSTRSHITRFALAATLAAALSACSSSGDRPTLSSGSASSTSSATPTTGFTKILGTMPVCKKIPPALASTFDGMPKIVRAIQTIVGVCGYYSETGAPLGIGVMTLKATLGKVPGELTTVPGVGPAKWVPAQRQLNVIVGGKQTLIVVFPDTGAGATKDHAVKIATQAAPHLFG